MTIHERDTMRGAAKGLLVIETFGAERPCQTIAEVAAASGQDRACLRRCLLVLADGGHADCDAKFFTLAPRLLRSLRSAPMEQFSLIAWRRDCDRWFASRRPRLRTLLSCLRRMVSARQGPKSAPKTDHFRLSVRPFRSHSQTAFRHQFWHLELPQARVSKWYVYYQGDRMVL